MGECYISNRLLVKILFENIKTWEVGNGINVSCCSTLDYVFGLFFGGGVVFAFGFFGFFVLFICLFYDGNRI